MNETTGPKVSVGIPTYNQAELLRQAIQSVLNQTYGHFEIIVVDDCSTDHTEAVVQDFEDPRIRYHKTAFNLRPPRSWNECARLAQGVYFSILPHDDLYEPDFLEHMVQALEQNPSLGFAQCAFVTVDKTLRVLGRRRIGETGFVIDGEKAVALQAEHYYCNPAAILFKRQAVFDQGLWDFHYWDDVVLILTIAFHNGFVYIPHCLSSVREHDSNLSKLLVMEKMDNVLNVINQQTALFGKILPMTPFLLRLRSRMNRKLGYSCMFYGFKSILSLDLKGARLNFDRGFCIYPAVLFDPRFYCLILSRLGAKLYSLIDKSMAGSSR